MEKHQRLCSGDPMMRKTMRSAMAMIELIFAIVIIAISIISIPSMISVADKASKQITIDDDVMSRLSGWTIDKFQARWDGNYEASRSGILWIAGADLGCNRASGAVWYRSNPDSAVQCDDQNRTPSSIPLDGNGSLISGIEQLNGGNGGLGELIEITPTGGTPYTVTATYEVDYVPSGLYSVNGNVATARWTLGGTTFDTANTGSTSHLKRIVTRFRNPDLQTDIVLTFFKSNKGN